jgi:HD-like signal output (HDOD) protein
MNAPARPDFVQAAARGALALPSVPRVVRRLIGQLQDGDASVVALVAELEQEPQLAARTLRIANSPYYSGRRTLANLSDAVVVIGTQALRTLVVSCGLQSVFVEVPGVNLRRFWTDAGVAGQAARGLARLAGADAEAAFLGGLLHGVGHLILCRAFPQAMQQQLLGAGTPRGAALAALETQACGFAHPLVGALWLDELGFPQAVVDAVAQQLDAQAAPLLAAALQVAAGLDALEGTDAVLARLDPQLIGVQGWREQFATQLPLIAKGLG